MARLPRFAIPGQPQHVILRGNNRTEIFCADGDYQFYLEKLQQACATHGCELHAYVLMGNHYHLFIGTPEGNLVEGMKWLQNTYTRRYNVRHRAWGRVFGDRYSRAERDRQHAVLPAG